MSFRSEAQGLRSLCAAVGKLVILSGAGRSLIANGAVEGPALLFSTGTAESRLPIRDLTNPALIWFKAALFLFTGFLAAGLILLNRPTLRTAALLAIALWSFCRLYYFGFYVVERYLPGRNYSGLLHALSSPFRRP